MNPSTAISADTPRPATFRVYLKWIFSLLPTLAMLAISIMKFNATPEMQAGFDAMRIDASWAFRLGVLSLILLALYWIPRTAFIGTILLTAYFGGASAFNLILMNAPPVLPIALSVMFWIGYVLRYPRVFEATRA